MAEESAELIDRFRSGDSAAAEALFNRYSQRLLALAKSRLSPKMARRFDADDVVQSVYRSFFGRLSSGDFISEQEGDLWRLLATITLHKLGRQVTRHRAAKRSIDRESGGSSALDLAEAIVDRKPTPADVVAAAEEVHWLMRQFEPIQRQALQLRIQAHTAEEIASLIGRSERTVRRWLIEARQLLIDRWAQSRSEDPVIADHSDLSHLPTEDSQTAAAACLSHADYKLNSLIGFGCMSKVYSATDRNTGLPVAVKVLRKRLRSRTQMVQRFLNEARTVSQFSHPGIVPVHGLGRLPDGGYFMVMDLIDGADLARITNDRPIEIQRAVKIVIEVALAIQYAHERGVIHRDLKPGNVLIDRDGRVYVTDFGFAWFDGENDRLPDAIVGTAGFMAPEQIDQSWGEIGPWTDVYGLGALLHMLCCGRPPIADGSISGMVDRISTHAGEISLDDFATFAPPQIVDVCRRCLAKNSRNRFIRAVDVADALRLWLPPRHPMLGE